MKKCKYVLYFGRDIVSNRAVSDEGIRAFLADVVSPIFPAFTYQDAAGYWKGKQERSFILTIITADDRVADFKNIIKIIDWYKDEFTQESVGLETSMVEFDLA
jgi:hypothetical protein